MFCTSCAAKNRDGTTACAACGRSLVGALPSRSATRLAPARFPASDRSRPRHGTVQSFLIVAPLLVVVVLGGSTWREAQRERAARYDQGRAAEATGDYAGAAAAFAAAGDVRDAAARRAAIVVALPEADAAFRTGLDALARNDPAPARTALRGVVRRLPDYRDGRRRLAEARAALESAANDRLASAEAVADWATAEGALRDLLRLRPGDPALANRLDVLHRERAPIALARDRALWLVSPDGTDPRRIDVDVPVARPIWSPDRRSIAFVSDDDDAAVGANTGYGAASDAVSLYVVGADGSNPRQVATTLHPYAIPAWSPDGTRLAFTSIARWNAPLERGLLTVHVADLATGTVDDVTSALGRHAVTPTWSADGRRLAVVSRARDEDAAADGSAGPADLYTIDLRTGRTENVTRGRVPEVVRALWSPDGGRILLYTEATGPDGGVAALGAGVDVVVVDPLDGRLETLAAGVDASGVGWSPVWSPDGAAVAYVDGTSAVAVVRDGAVRRIHVGRFLSGALSWSPDGGALLAVAADPSDTATVIRFDESAVEMTSVALRHDVVRPTGSPVWSSPGGNGLAPGGPRFGTALDGMPAGG